MKKSTSSRLPVSLNENQSSLNLLKYSALAVGFMAVNQEAEAQTIYFDYVPDQVVTLEIDSFNATTSYIEQYADEEIDLLRDGIVDASFVFTGSRYVGIGTDIRSSWIFEPKTSRLNVAQRSGFWGAAFQAERFGAGDVIDDNLDWYSGPALLYRFTQFESTYVQVGSWSNGGSTQGALALRYEINPGNYVYGYLRLFLADEPTPFGDCCATLQDLRWNMDLNQPITVDPTPPAGSCATPVGLLATPLSPSTIALDWTPDAMAPKTQLQGKAVTAVNFGNVITTGSSRTFNGLTPGQTYEWKARSLCSNGLLSDMSPLSTFTMPLLVAPSETEGEARLMQEELHELNVSYRGREIILQASAPISRYVLHDLNGKTMLAANATGNRAVIDADLPAGIYVVMVEIGSTQSWEKVVVR